MRRCASFLLLSLLLLNCGQQQLVNATPVDLAKLFDAVGTFVPTSKPLMDTAKSIWNTFDQTRNLFVNASEAHFNRAILEKIKEKMENVDDHVLEVGEKVDTAKKDITQEIAKDNKLLAIEGYISNVFAQFEIFLVYQSHNVDNDTQINFYNSLIGHGTDSLTSLLYVVHEMVTSGKTNTELMELIVDPEQSVALMCKWKRSPMHVLNTLYNQITSAELKAMILIRYAYWYLDNGDFNKHENTIEAYDALVKSRLDKTILHIKHFMQHAGREFWSCESGYKYEKLGPIFFNYVASEQDIGEEYDGSIRTYYDQKDCAYFTKDKFHHVCKSKLCKIMKKNHKGPVMCNGYMRDCYSHELGSDMEICLGDAKSGRMLKKLSIGGKVFGKNIECPNYKAKYVPWSFTSGTWFNMENCVCTCDDFVNNSLVRLFNLREVTSDIDQNKVITGVKMVLKDKAFQFEIQQGTVTEFGNMNETTVAWKKEESTAVSAGQDFYKVMYDSRTVNLDVLDAPPNTVLTGLRFGKNKNGALQLEIRYTPIDFASGKLDASKSDWKTPSEEGKRPEIKFNTGLPKGNWFKPAQNRAYLKFTTSSLEEDIGQTVVPFIDTAKVEGIPATMLSGAGLIYKGSEHSAGFLSIKLLTYNFQPHLIVDLKDAIYRI